MRAEDIKKNKNPVFITRMSAIGDVIIASRTVQYFVDNNFEPIFISSTKMIDVLLKIKDLRHIICLDEQNSPLYFFDGKQRPLDNITQLFPTDDIVSFCDLQNTVRSKRAINVIIQILGRKNKTKIFRVKKQTFFRFLLILKSKIHFHQNEKTNRPLSVNKTIQDLQLDLINQFFLTHHSQPISSHSKKLFLSSEKHSAKIDYVAIFPGASGVIKTWPKSHFQSLIQLILTNTKLDVYVCGDRHDTKHFSDLNAANFGSKRVHNVVGQHSLSKTLDLIANASYIISNDSFPGHAADAYQVPGVILFGSTSPLFGFIPAYQKIDILYLNLSCSPCSRHGKGKCRYQNLKCLTDIKPSDVFERLLKNTNQITIIKE